MVITNVYLQQVGILFKHARTSKYLKQSKQNNNNSERHLKSNRYRQELVFRCKLGANGVKPNFYG